MSTISWCKQRKHPRHWIWAGNSPVTGEFPTQRASNAENVSIWWHHHIRTRFSLNDVEPELSCLYCTAAANDIALNYYTRCGLHIKSTICNIIGVEECGQMQPFNDLPDTKLIKLNTRNWTAYINVVWIHGSPKHANWPNNTRLIFHLIIKISK